MKRSFQIAYLAVGALTVLEFLFVRGMFTWLIMTIAVAAAGAANILLACRDREFLGALQYLLCSVALTMGYLSLA
ncbi:hypothetical protein [Dysosmobacter sp.]